MKVTISLFLHNTVRDWFLSIDQSIQYKRDRQLHMTDIYQLPSVAIKIMCITSQIFSQDKKLNRALDKNLYAFLRKITSFVILIGIFVPNQLLPHAKL